MNPLYDYVSTPLILLLVGRVMLYRCVAVLAATLFSFPVLGADFAGRVVRVIDGDTTEVLHEGRAEQVRLNGIDCPEMGQAFGRRAKQFTSDRAFGKTVSVKVLARDRYDRIIGEVTLPDGKSLNLELVSADYAWWYRRYAPNDHVREKLENEARNAKRGLWVDPIPVPPWEYRRSHGAVLNYAKRTEG